MSVENVPTSLDTTPSELRNWTDRDQRATLAGRRAAETQQGAAAEKSGRKSNVQRGLSKASKAETAPVEAALPEGDTLALSHPETAEVSYAEVAKRPQASDARPEVEAELLDASVDRQVSLSIEGEMTAEELRNIKKMLASISPIAVYPPGPLVLDGTGFESMSGFEMHTRHSLDVTEINIRRKPTETETETDIATPSGAEAVASPSETNTESVARPSETETVANPETAPSGEGETASD